MVKQIRDYQQEAVDAAFLHLYGRGYSGTIIHLATGLGKTIIATEFVRQKMNLNTQRVIFLVNYQNIVHQSVRAFKEQIPELNERSWTSYGKPGIGVEMGNYSQPDARLLVATPQTLSGVDGTSPRLEEVLKYGAIDLVIYDEAHYAVAPSYLQFRDRLRDSNPDVRALGLTATPKREDDIRLSLMFDTICYSRNIWWGVHNGFLCPIQDPLLIETNLELPDVGGDIEDRAKALDVGNWAEIIFNGYVEHGEDRQGVAFMPSVDHSIRFTEYLNEHGIPAAHIDGEKCIDPDGVEHPTDYRYTLFNLHRERKIKVLSNFNVLLVGWDAPWVDLILWARPTNNSVLLTQGIGRGTRTYPGKRDLKILDFTLKDTGILLTGTLLGIDPKTAKTDEEEESVVEEDFLEGMDLRDMKPRDALVNGKGLIVRVGSLFRKLSDAWYHHPETGTLSLSVAEDAMFMVHPPNYTLANRLREGIENGEAFLAREDLSPQDRQRGEIFLDTLLRAYDFYSQYTAWFIAGIRNEQTGKISWKRPDRWIAGEDSIELLLDHLTPLIAEREDPALSKKNKQWRRPSVPPTDAQISLLKRMGIQETPMTRGDASKMISHKIAWDKVFPVIDLIRQSCGKYGVIHENGLLRN